MNRRGFLLSTSVSALALVGGCSTPGPTPTPGPGPVTPPTPSLPQTVLDYISQIAAAFQKMLPNLQSVIPTNIFAQVSTWVGEITTLASSIQSGLNGGSIISAVSTFADLVAKVIGAVSGGSAPSWVGALVAAAQALLPLILSAVGVAARRSAVAGSMSPDQASRVLVNFLNGPNPAARRQG